MITMIRKRIKADNAVSPVIASLLILVLTIFLIGIAGIAVMNVGSTDAAPIAGISISETSGVIFLTHFSGATLPAGEYKILVNGIDKTNKFQPVGQDLAPGTKLAWELGITQPLTHVSVIYTGEGKSVVIAEKTFYREGTAVANAKFTISDGTEGKNVTDVVKKGLPISLEPITPTDPLPGVVANKADIWMVIDSGSGQATLEFTAVEIGDDVTYSWSCPGADILDSTARITTIKFSNNMEPYEVTLTVTNGYVSDSSTKKIMIRNPGITGMIWVQATTAYFPGTFFGRGHEHLYESNHYQWHLSSYLGEKGFAMKIKDAGGVKPEVLSNAWGFIKAKNWYHVAGTFEQNAQPLNLKIYVDGYEKNNKTVTGALTGPDEILRMPLTTASFNKRHSWYEIPFALTPAEISSVHTAEYLAHPKS